MKIKKIKFNELSNEKLLEQQKLTKVATGALAGTLTVLLITVLLLAIKKGLNVTSISLGVIPFALMPILFLNWNTLKEIQTELNSRKITN